jgi:hypothetical protein
MLSKIRSLGPIVASGLALAAVPALAAPGGNGHGKPDKPDNQKPKGVAHVFKGVYNGDGTVAVDHTNKHARPYDETTVAFDFSAAKLSVADTDGSGVVDLTDVYATDRVVVKAKLPKARADADAVTQPFAARQLVDQTHPAPEETG